MADLSSDILWYCYEVSNTCAEILFFLVGSVILFCSLEKDEARYVWSDIACLKAIT